LHTDSAFALLVWQQVQLAKNACESRSQTFSLAEALLAGKKPHQIILKI